jgi:CrcB protein
MITVLLVGAGGFLGAIARYGVGRGLGQVSAGSQWIPYGTLAANVTGCLLIGVVAGLMDHRQVLSTDFRAFLVVGLLGGFTTFSAFGYETFTLARAGDINATIANIGIQIAAGLGAVWLGYRLATVG